MNRFARRCLALAALALLLAGGAHVRMRLWPMETTGQDIYYSWVEGARLLAGENPYERVLAGDMQQNDKYATYFPLFYELSALSQAAGAADYADWIALWRRVFLASDLALAVLLFAVFDRRGRMEAGLFAAAFWLFSRWSLQVTAIAHLDGLPLFFLVASLAVRERSPRASWLLFGTSLALKQMAIFLVPFYLVAAWQRDDATTATASSRWAATVAAAAWIAAVPLLCSLPFLAWNARGFVASVLFSATRNGETILGAPSVDILLGWSGLAARLPMLGLMGLVLAMSARRTVGPYGAALLVMATFVSFNTVLFRQYMLWIVPLVPLAAMEWGEGETRRLLSPRDHHAKPEHPPTA